MVQEETYKETKQPQDQTIWPDMCKFMSDAARKKAKQNGLSRNQSSIMPDNAREIFFIEPDDEKFKPIMKAVRRKLEVPMPTAMRCKITIKSCGDTHRNIGKRKTECDCVVDADEGTRPRLEGAGHKPHQDHIIAKGTNSITHESLVHKFIPMPRA